MRFLSSIFVALAMVLLLSVSPNAQAAVVYGLGSSNLGFEPCCPPCFEPPCQICICDEVFETDIVSPFFGESAFYKISPETGIPTFIGYTGFGACRGLDIHPLTGEFYAVCNRILSHEGPPGSIELTTNEEEIGQVLVHIDENTGEGTEIGPLGDGIGALRFSFVSDISFHPDGTLHAHLNSLSPVYMIPFNPEETLANGLLENTLGTIDLDTGLFSPIGPTNSGDFASAIGFSTELTLKQCANFDDRRIRFIDEDGRETFTSYSNFNHLDLIAGNAKLVRQINYPPEVDGHLNIITSKDVDTETGIFYAFLNTEEFFTNGVLAETTNNLIPDGTYLVRIDPDNSQVDIVGQTSPPVEDFLAIAIKKSKLTRNVPTMSEYGLMATAVLLLGASALYLRRRQAKLEV